MKFAVVENNMRLILKVIMFQTIIYPIGYHKNKIDKP